MLFPMLFISKYAKSYASIMDISLHTRGRSHRFSPPFLGGAWLNFFRASRGTGTFSPPQADFFWGLPEQRYGKTFPFVYRGVGTGREGGKAEG